MDGHRIRGVFEFLGIGLVISYFVLLISILPAFSADVSLTWDPNSEEDLMGYRIHYGYGSGDYCFSLEIFDDVRCQVRDLEEGVTYYFAATAFDEALNESGYSNEVVYTPPCTFTISSDSSSFDTPGGNGTVQVTTQSACTWAAVSNSSWLVITSNSTHQGPGGVNFSVMANPDVTPRTATLTIAENIHTVIQSGIPQYSLTIARTGNGTGQVLADPSGTKFQGGTLVTLTAVPDPNSSFSEWSGGVTGTSTTAAFTINADLTVTAAFMLKTFTIRASAGANGSISPQGALTVNHGSTQMFNITPNTYYRVEDVKVDGISQGAITSYTFSNVTADRAIEATFTPIVYTLTVNKTGTGSGTVVIDPPGPKINAGTVVNLTAVPASDSEFSAWSGGITGSSLALTFTMNEDTTVTATFSIKTYTIAASAGPDGSIFPQGPIQVTYGSTQSFTISANPCYRIEDLRVDGVPIGPVNSYTLSNVTENHTIQASFLPITYSLTLSQAGTGTGTVQAIPSGTLFNACTVVTLTAIADESSVFSGWSADVTGPSSPIAITMNSNVAATATFTLKTYTLTASVEGNGTISPQGTLIVNHGASQIFTLSPERGYQIGDVRVDDISVGGVSSYNFMDITANHTIQAFMVFVPPGPTTLLSPSGKTYTGTPTYTWIAVPETTEYYLWVNDYWGNKINQWYTSEEAGCPSGTGICSLTSPVQLAAGIGRWWVQTSNPAGDGPWSEPMDFTIAAPPAPLLISPFGRIGDTTPTYVWNPSVGATKYNLLVIDPTGVRIQKSYTVDELGCASEGSTCSVTPFIGLKPGSCRFSVRGWSPTGYGPWSSSMFFTVSP
jgi:hypothetical protein